MPCRYSKHFLQDAGKAQGASSEHWTLHMSNLAYMSALAATIDESWSSIKSESRHSSHSASSYFIQTAARDVRWLFNTATGGPDKLSNGLKMICMLRIVLHTCLVLLLERGRLSMDRTATEHGCCWAGLGRTLDDHEENRDHVSRVSIVNSDCYLHICWTAILTTRHQPSSGYTAV